MEFKKKKWKLITKYILWEPYLKYSKIKITLKDHKILEYQKLNKTKKK